MKINVALVAGLVLASTCAWGQAASTAQITGTVADTSGLAVPGAEAKATQTATGLIRVVTTGADGGYVLTNLPVGPYQLEVSKDGFTKYLQGGIVLQVGNSTTIGVTLRVGAVSEQVRVEANANLVEMRNAGVGKVIENQRILELPLNGRQVTELVYLTGLATSGGSSPGSQPGGSGYNSGTRHYPTAAIAVAGGLVNGVVYALDGGVYTDPYSHLPLPLPFPDALQEFKVETSAISAQYGRHAAGVVNGVTKSGTNSFHGDAFEFIRNSATNARNAFATTQDGLKRNQFGGVIGGPIKANKLFFFVGLQTTLQRIAPASFVSFVPTAAMRAGDFTTIASPQCNNGRQINLTGPFVGNRIAPSLLSPPAMNILNLKGFPTSPDPCGQVSFGRRTNSNEYLGAARMDFQKSDRHSLFIRYTVADLLQPTDADPSNLIVGDKGTGDFLYQSVVLGDTYLIGANTVSSFRATLNRTAVSKEGVPFFDASDVGINTYVGVPKLLPISVTGGFSIGSSNSRPWDMHSLAYQFSEDLSIVRGAHQLGFGGTFIHSKLNIVSALNASGSFAFNGQVTGLGMADFMVGKPSQFSQGTPNQVYQRENYVALYAQDTWRAASRFTLTYGLRWDPMLPIWSKPGWISNFDPDLFARGIKSTQYTNAPAGLQYPGDPGYPGKSAHFGRLNNFAPRLALAWDPQGNGRMSIRAAYGILFEQPVLAMYNVFTTSSPFGASVTVPFPANFADPWGGVPAGNPFPITPARRDSPFVTFGAFENFPLRFKTTNSQQWNLSIQRQLGADWMMEANYLGNVARHLPGGNQGNPSIYIPGSCVINGANANPCSTPGNVNFRRSLYLQNPSQGQYFGNIDQLDTGGTASFNALVLSAQKRSSKGYSLHAIYTWSHCISDLVAGQLGGATQNFMIPDNRRADRSNCAGTDRRHNLNLSGVYETPRFKHAALRTVASDWQISTIFRMVSGAYLSVLTGIDQALTGQANQRPNQVLEDPYTPGRPLSRYLNPAAFAQPALGTYGNLGNYAIRGMGAITLNMGLTRTVKVKEKYNVQFRVEAFNVPNHLNPGTPTGVSGPLGVTTPTVALNNPQFGKVLSADDPRIFQGALKFVF